jgi:hypothetical protein
LATDFPEIRRIVSHYNVGVLINRYEPEFLAETIKTLSVQEKDKIGFAKANAELTWEKESVTLLEIIKQSHFD